MTRRSGLSLIEVLAAIFIMGVGMVSIFTLFPYGAINMAQALRDDRTAQSAAAADAYMRWYWKDQIAENPANRANEALFLALENPNADSPLFGGAIPGSSRKTTMLAISPTSTDPSYPVAVDPMGWEARGGGGADQFWVSETVNPSNSGFIARRTLHEVRRNTAFANVRRAQALRTCSMLDGLTYDTNGRAADANGTAAETSGGTIQREMRYNWLWVLQRPDNSNQLTAKMTVVVFDKRAHMFAPPTAETGYFPTAAAVGDSRLQFGSGNAPAVRKGSWILDGTSTPNGSVRNANFYRVVSATTDASGNLDIELATPLKPDSKTTGAPDPGASRRFYVLNGVVDVYERKNLTASTGP